MAQTTLPPLDVLGPDGDRIILRALDRDDTVGRLAERLGVDWLSATGRALDPSERLADVDELRIGARLAWHRVGAPVDDRARAADQRGVVHSASVDSAIDPAVVDPAIVEFAVVAGPATSSWMPLPAGRHLVGRARHARLHLDDPGVEAHHGLLLVDADGSIVLMQLCGASPIRIGGRALESGGSIGLDDRVTVGSSTLRFRTPRTPCADLPGGEPVGTIAAHPSDPWRRIVWRAPHRRPTWSPRPVVAPVAEKEPARPAVTGLIGVAVAAVGAVVIAQLMGNAMFMMFAAMGALASLTTFTVATHTARRRRTKMRAEHAEQVEEFRRAVEQLHVMRMVHHRSITRSMVETHDETLGGGSRIWQRRLGEVVAGGRAGDNARGEAHDQAHGEVALRSVIGTGTHRWRPAIEVRDPAALDPSLLQRVEASAQLIGVDAPFTIRPGDSVAFHGATPFARSVARAVIVQLATWVGPADWQLVVVSTDTRAWRWVDWLPHGALDGAALISVDGADIDGLGNALDAVDVERTTLLVTDEPHLFTARTGALRRFVSASGAASIVVVDTDATVPAMCRRVLTVGSTGSASWTGDMPDEDDTVAIEFAGISIDTADEIARRLACLVDPEDDGGSGGGVPKTVSFAELIPPADTTAEQIARRWREGGADPAPSAPLGSSVDGRIDIDLVRDGPHGLIAGTTGAGKSELLRTLVLSMAASVGPQHLNFVLVDYKGGSTFDACTALPHTVGLVTDLDDGLAERALVSLDAELHRRERMLRAVAASDLTEYRSRRQSDGALLDSIARLVVVIDEFAALAKELPDFLNALVGIAERGRSLGVHLLLATQRPAGVVNDDIRANTNLRLALRLHDRADAMDVVGDELPAKFARGLPGRAALRLGPDELVVFQAARCTGPSATGAPGGMVVERPDRSIAGVGTARPRPPRNVDVQAESEASSEVGMDPEVEVVADVERSELEVIAEAIVAAAAVDGACAPHRVWVEALPFPLRCDDLDRDLDDLDSGGAVIGAIDDPERQRRIPLAWAPSDGSLALIGSIGSGTTSTMISLATAICRVTPPDRLHLHVIDARGDDGLHALSTLAHCGGVVRITEDERTHRLLRRVVDVIDDRMTDAGDTGPDHVVMIDGYASVRNALGTVERQATFDLLQRVVDDGPAARVSVVIADDVNSAVTIAPVAHRWLFHLDDPSAARALGLRAAPAPPGKPGRLRILACGREAQVAQGAAGLAELPAHGEADGGPEPIVALPEIVEAQMIRNRMIRNRAVRQHRGGIASLPVGVSSIDLGVATLDLIDGDHVLIVGSPRVGVSTALARCVEAWEVDARRRGVAFEVIRIGRRETPRAGEPSSPPARRKLTQPEILQAIDDPSVRICVVADDAHGIDDPGVLAAIAKGEHPHVTIIAGARADAIRSGYGHWTREVARGRCGIVMTSRGEPDGDLLGVQIPRRALIPARPGLAWLVDGGPLRLAQIATD